MRGLPLRLGAVRFGGNVETMQNNSKLLILVFFINRAWVRGQPRERTGRPTRNTGFTNTRYFEDGLETSADRTNRSEVSVWKCEFRCELVGTSDAWPRQKFHPGIST